ncbi:MAG TPA: winged helix-turn-helix domain-containing protein [Blastocatellia bacterium]|nr:winged helix-turn-helix domain-containing protein [Blastocatellia bacterium]
MTTEQPRIYEFGRFRLDRAERTLQRGGEPVSLTPKVFGILLALVENSGRVVGKDELMRQVWPDSFVEEGNLTQNISLLRKALGETSDGKPFIETVARRGYRFAASVRQSADGEAAQAGANGDLTARHAFAPPLSTDGAVTDVTLDRTTGDNGAAAVAVAARPAYVSTATASDVGSVASSVATRRRLITGIRGRLLRQRVALLAAIVLLVAATVAFIFFRANRATSGSGNIDSIAVLPFVADAGDAETEFLNDRLAENLINNLAQLPKLRVVPRSLAFNYKGNMADLQKVGRELGARAVLTGRIHRQGDALSIQADLIDVANVSQIWGRHYDRKIADLLLVPEDISKDIFENLRLKLSVEEKKQLEASRYYLLGRNALNKRTAGGLQQGLEYFQKAIDIDADDAAAYAGLADCYNMLVVYGIRMPKDAFPLAQEAALKALELDDNLAEAHTSLAFIKHRWNWERQDAEREFLRAIKDKPAYGPAHQWYSSYLVAVGRTDEAIAEARRAAELDPLSFSTGIHLGWIYYMAGRYDEAIAHCLKLLAVDPGFFPVYRYLGLSYEQKGMYKEAIAAFDRGIKLSGSPLLVALIGHAYAVAGNRKEAERVLDELQEMSGQRYVSPCTVAAIYAGLRDSERTFEWLEKAIAERDIWLMNLRVDPVFKEMRGDRRFKAILLRLGLIP